MGEVKFRWVGRNRKFNEIQINSDLTIQKIIDGNVLSFFNNSNRGKDGNCEFLSEDLFIGLKDKNGKDIYEGDFDQHGDVVRWCDVRNGWAMSSYDFPTKEHIFCHCYNCDGNFEISEIIKEIEIKGSIHQNPELLK